MQYFGGSLYIISEKQLLTVDVGKGEVTATLELTRQPTNIGVFQNDLQDIRGNEC